MQEAGVAEQSYQRTGRPPVDRQPEGTGEFSGAPVPPSLDEKQVERVLATARALLAGSLVAAIAFASGNSPFGQIYWLVISGYCIYCLALIVLYRLRRVDRHKGRLVIHIADLLWAGVMSW